MCRTRTLVSIALRQVPGFMNTRAPDEVQWTWDANVKKQKIHLIELLEAMRVLESPRATSGTWLHRPQPLAPGAARVGHQANSQTNYGNIGQRICKNKCLLLKQWLHNN